MMSELPREEENEMRRNAGDIRDTGPVPDGLKPDPTQSSHGPLSSLKAVIKRTKSKSQIKHSRGNYKRRPEITILSAEPLDSGKGSPGRPLVSSAPRGPPPQRPQSFHQVQETQEEHVPKPVAPPRRLNCTTTDSTQDAAAPTTTAGKRPPKPPRPCAPKNKKAVSADPINVYFNSTPSHSNQDTESSLALCTQTNGIRSVTVYWSNTPSTETTSTTTTAATTTTTTTTTSTTSIQPVPLPRIKSKRPRFLPEESHTLVQLSENSNCSNCTADTVSSNKYLEELLEVFNSENTDILNQSRAETEDADEMSGTNSLRARIKAFENQADEAAPPAKPQPKSRTKPPVAAKPSEATTPQFSTDDLYEEVCYSPPTPAPKPKPAQKPEGAAGNSSVTEELKSILAQHRSKPPKLTRDNSVHDEEFVKVPPTLPAKPSAKEPLKPNQNINNHNNYAAQPVYEDAENGPMGGEESAYSEYEYADNLGLSTSEAPHDPMENEYDIPDNTYGDDTSRATEEPENTQSKYDLVEYAPSTSKEPDCVDKTYEDKTSNNFPVKPEPTKSNYAGSRQSLTKRPTTIIVPSKSTSFSDGFQDSPPPLPVQKPVGTLNTPQRSNRHSIASFTPQASPSAAPEPSLPPRRLTTKKNLPPRPLSVGSGPGPGRPPPPRVEATSHTNSTSRDTPPKPQPPKPQKKGLVLPPRPNPGHQLYNKYTLQVPHAVASSDYSGSSTGELSFQKNEVLVLVNTIDPNTFECQVGDRRGRVHRSSMKVITPLSTASQATPLQAGKPTGSSSGLTVEVLHDFSPENPGELGLKAGDVVTMVEQVDDEWYRGTCRGSSGFFPINYAKVLTNSPRLPDRTGVKPAVTVSGPRCVARFDFESEHSDELSFSEGDVIQLKAYVGQDWARGQLGAFSGIFPLNFVEIIQDLPPAPSQKQQQTPLRKIALPGMSKSARSKVAPPAQVPQCGAEWVVALYDFTGNSEGDLSFEKGERILIIKHIDQEWSSGRLDGREGIFPQAFVESKTAGQTSHQNGGAGGVKAKALYDFASTSEEELSIKVGDIVTNVESVDNQWFLCDLRGKRALVPKNYVQVM